MFLSSLAILFIGFSVFSAALLALTHFKAGQYQDHFVSRLMGILLLFALSALQIAHFQWIYLDQKWVASVAYVVTLYSIAPAFFLFSQPLLHPTTHTQLSIKSLGHLLPLLLAPWLPVAFSIPLAFIVGAGYLLWLAYRVYALRNERAGFRLEIVLLGAVFVIAIGVSVLGLLQAALAEKLFFCLYAIAVGLAFFLVQLTLYIRPQLVSEVRETALSTYHSSTLSNVDCEEVLRQLEQLMQQDKLYEDAALNLPILATRLELRPHQLSELINTQLGKGFSRYLRELRVAAAAQRLCDQPALSVLAVGLSVGFTSQSNFYQAFREVEGTTPGRYRKMHKK